MAFNITNKFLSSSLGKVLSGQDWRDTAYGGNIIPEYTVTDGQKRYNSKSAIPNLAKPETLFFVYFNINAKAQNLIQKRRDLIDYLSKLQQQEMADIASSYQQTQKDVKENNIVDTINNSISSTLNSFSKSFNNAKDAIQEKFKKSNATEDYGTNGQNTADYIPDKMLLKQLSYELSKFVKSIDKPTISYKINEYNEYNRKRLCYDGRSYNPINITFYDVKENPVQQFFFAYLKMIDDTFLCKNSTNYKKPVYTQVYDTIATDWGFNTDSNFRLIDSISIIEMYMDKMMVYTLENPVLESINFGKNNIGSYKPSEISVKFQYEGITNDLLVGEFAKPVEPYTNTLSESNNEIYLKAMINSNINPDIATFIQKRYKSGAANAVDTASAFIKGILDAPKSDRNGKIFSQILDTGRKLGFANEIDTVNKAIETVDNYKNAENKGHYILKMTDDPSSVLGTLTASNITTSDTSPLGFF